MRRLQKTKQKHVSGELIIEESEKRQAHLVLLFEPATPQPLVRCLCSEGTNQGSRTLTNISLLFCLHLA